MGIGMALGVIVGAMAPSLGLQASWFKPLGDLFITLVRMVVVPLVFCTLIAGADRIMDMARTSINVLGDATGALFVSKWEGPDPKEC